jgi:hypothetical protein
MSKVFKDKKARNDAFYEIFVMSPIGSQILEYLKNKYYYAPSYQYGGRAEDAIFNEGKKDLIRDILIHIKDAEKI